MKKNLGAKPYLFPQPIMIITSYDEHGEVNAMNAAWGGIVGMDQIIISLGDHQTTDNIMTNKAFTVSMADIEHVAACDYVGLVSKRNELNKLEIAGFHTTKSEFVNAPVIDELPLALECELVEVLNGLILGKIVNVCADEKIVKEKDGIDMEAFSPITYDTANLKYYALGNCVGDAFKIGQSLKK